VQGRTFFLNNAAVENQKSKPLAGDSTMNSQLVKVNKFTEPSWFLPIIKITTRKNPIEARQLFLISRIMISVFTVGLIGYTLDRAMQSLQRRSLGD
jgi:hypothetical protein